MNTMQLLQSACAAWLKTADPLEIPLNARMDFLRCINGAQAEVWRKLPLHYRRKDLVLNFPGLQTGTVRVAADGLALSAVTFAGIPDLETYRYSSINVSGDSKRNEFLVSSLLMQWPGPDFGVDKPATLYGDAVMVPWLIESIVFPLMEPEHRQEWRAIQGFRPRWWDTCGRYEYLMDRIKTGTQNGTLFRLPPADGRSIPLILRGTMMVAPVEITLETSQRAVELTYDDETANFIIGIAGVHLQTHRYFDSERLNASMVRETASMVREQLSLLAQNPVSQFNSIGTPYGY